VGKGNLQEFENMEENMVEMVQRKRRASFSVVTGGDKRHNCLAFN